jgi:hypothetical protein
MVHKEKRLKCVDKHGLGTEGHRVCITTSKQYKALKHWIDNASPVIQGSLILLVSGLTIAEKTKDDDFNWLFAIAPAVCALTEAMNRFGSIFPPSRQKQILAVLVMIKGVSCGAK